MGWIASGAMSGQFKRDMKTPQQWIAEAEKEHGHAELTEQVVLRIQDDTLYHAVGLIEKHGLTGPNGGLNAILKAKIALQSSSIVIAQNRSPHAPNPN